jgi:hypothetical protein
MCVLWMGHCRHMTEMDAAISMFRNRYVTVSGFRRAQTLSLATPYGNALRARRFSLKASINVDAHPAFGWGLYACAASSRVRSWPVKSWVTTRAWRQSPNPVGSMSEGCFRRLRMLLFQPLGGIDQKLGIWRVQLEHEIPRLSCRWHRNECRLRLCF